MHCSDMIIRLGHNLLQAMPAQLLCRVQIYDLIESLAYKLEQNGFSQTLIT